MPGVTSKDLLLISKAPKEKLDAFAAGAALIERTGYDINRLRIKAALDRLALARSVLKSAQLASKSKPPMHRVTVSRAYYSMYHAFRCASFFVFGGDDHEKHLDLPSKLPRDFPDRANWENALKGARLERNRADYDPYPKRDRNFAATAAQLISDAEALMPLVSKYLKNKGCF